MQNERDDEEEAYLEIYHLKLLQELHARIQY